MYLLKKNIPESVSLNSSLSHHRRHRSRRLKYYYASSDDVIVCLSLVHRPKTNTTGKGLLTIGCSAGIRKDSRNCTYIVCYVCVRRTLTDDNQEDDDDDCVLFS